MLSRDQLQELGRFKLLMRKMHNQSVQIEKFLTDIEYQSQMLDIAEEFDDSDIENDELMMLSLVLRSKFGRLGHGDEAYASIVPVIPHTAPVEVVTQMSEPVLKIPSETIASFSTSSVSLLRSIGSSFASALNPDSGLVTTQASNTLESDSIHSKSDKVHYVMSLR
jgi:hypothetical protein